jgi:hypothetical protein
MGVSDADAPPAHAMEAIAQQTNANKACRVRFM